MIRHLLLAVGLLAALYTRSEAAPCVTTGPDLVVDGITCQLSGVWTFQHVRVINNGVIEVNPYNGSANKIATGNLELRARTITIDARLAHHRARPRLPDAALRRWHRAQRRRRPAGGCSVRDSGGGGAHFGIGGRGTKRHPGPHVPRATSRRTAATR